MTARSNSIVDQAIQQLCDWPEPPALVILDRAMDGHHGEHLDFESCDPLTGKRPHPAYADETDPGTPFADLLRKAFDPTLDPRELLLLGRAEPASDDQLRVRINAVADRWRRVIEKFGDRYQLWT
jgi:hypothetical protein